MEFARAQVEAGVDLIGVGDAAASLVGPQIYEEFVRPYEQKLVDGLHAMGAKVRLHICGNIRRILPGIGSLGCEMVDIDSMVPLAQARQEMGPEVVLAGNIDPVKTLRNGTPESITAAIAECHRQAGPRYIVGAGCEVPRDTPESATSLWDVTSSGLTPGHIGDVKCEVPVPFFNGPTTAVMLYPRGYWRQYS